MTIRNILYLHCHDAGRWLSPYGHPVPTPNLDKLGRKSLLFRNAHCVNPTCSPSRAGLLTGQWAHQQMLGLAHRGFGLKHPERHLGNFLRGHGYRTVLCGFQHEYHDSREGWPYDEEHQPEKWEKERVDNDKAALAEAFLESDRAADPFFLSVGFFYPHRPFPEVDDPSADYLAMAPTLPDDAVTRRDMAGYHEAVGTMDRAAGRVLDALERTGRADDTLVLFTTDHGVAFPWMKCNLYDAGTGVAMMLRMPGQTKGSVSDSLVSHVDVYPTLCDLLDLPKPEWLEGVSLAPVLHDPSATVRDHLFAEVNDHAAYEPKRAIRTERFKLIVNCDDAHDTPPMANIDGGGTKTVLMKGGLQKKTRPRVELYDLLFDPAERNDLAEDPGHADIREDLMRRLRDWQERTDDPILDGPLPLPPGGKRDPHEAADYS